MMEEGTRFQDLVHQNIYPLIGIVDGDGCRPLLVYPSVTYGNLKRLIWEKIYISRVALLSFLNL